MLTCAVSDIFCKSIVYHFLVLPNSEGDFQDDTENPKCINDVHADGRVGKLLILMVKLKLALMNRQLSKPFLS